MATDDEAVRGVAYRSIFPLRSSHDRAQTPDGPKWPNHAQILNRLGNLTLLGRSLNTSIKNADFATKKRDGYAGSDILLTRELLALDIWDTAAIERRQRELSEWVFDIWKFPGEAAPAKAQEQAVEPEKGPPEEKPEATTLDQLPEVP